jgi:hypothetical protein
MRRGEYMRRGLMEGGIPSSFFPALDNPRCRDRSRPWRPAYVHLTAGLAAHSVAIAALFAQPNAARPSWEA